MKGLFQCPPRATPWVNTQTQQRPVRAKALNMKLLPLQGDFVEMGLTQGVALG